MWVKRKQKRKKLIIFVTSLVLSIAVVFSTVSLCINVSRNNDYIIKENTFFDDKTLRQIGLPDLKPIEENRDSTLEIKNKSIYKYRTLLKSDEEFEEYLSYLFEQIKSSNKIDYYGNSLRHIGENENRTYVKQSESIEEYCDNYGEAIKKDAYTFYLINKNKLNAIIIHVSKGIDRKGNDTLYIDINRKYQNVYLFEDFFEIKEIDVNKENFLDYFIINNENKDGLIRVSTKDNIGIYNANLNVKLNVSQYGEFEFSIVGNTTNTSIIPIPFYTVHMNSFYNFENELIKKNWIGKLTNVSLDKNQKIKAYDFCHYVDLDLGDIGFFVGDHLISIPFELVSVTGNLIIPVAK